MKQPFIPHNLPIKDLQWDKLIKLVGEANSNLSKYNGALLNIINPSLLLTTFATKEAVLSTKIEGTQASFEEVLQKDSKKYNESKILDIEEIENCKKALEYGINELKNKPLCLKLIKEIHSILLDSVRGHNKDRGNFRKIKNFIGFTGATIEQASYIPPSPDIMQNSLYEWEKYIHLESEEILIQLSVIHAQFETIHPFLDGNGRIGRILIPLFLYAKNYLNFPAFYMSEYLELHRSEYYNSLQNTRYENGWQEWIEFFLRGIIEQSKISYNRVQKVVLLHKSIQNILPKITQSKYLPEIINIIFEKPILIADDVMQRIPNIDNPTILRILNKLSEPMEYELRKNFESNLFEYKEWLSIEKSNKEYSILKKTQGSGTKPSSYEFVELLNIIDNRV
jgi:Fic family protein